MMMRLQVTRPAALSGASPVVVMQSMRPMDLLEASLGSVPAAAVRKAVKTWATRRQFWGGKNDPFKGEMGTNGSGGQIWQIRRHSTAHMNVADEGSQGGEVSGNRGDRKVVLTHGGVRATGVVVVVTQQCFVVVGSYVGEKVLSPHDIKMVSY